MQISGTGSSLLRALTFVLLCLPSLFTVAQTASPAPPPIESYPENVGGLKRLVKDIMKAQKENPQRAGALIDTFVIPNYQKWYLENFDRGAVAQVLPKYQASERTLSAQFAGLFLRSQMEGMTDVEVVRFDKNCDDNASEQTFNTLDARLKDVPLYELRLFKGTQFRRVFAFAYIDGGFRFVLTPDFSETASHSGSSSSVGGEKVAPRIKQGGTVTAARLINRVQPVYPESARQEFLSGTVRLHAIINKEGNVSELRVISGRCSLARASVDAVRKWRYMPTLFNGEPVEVDTTIDVIFSLNR